MVDWPHLRAIVERAVELSAEARAAWLDEACAGDPELRREADSLLAAALEEGSFLEPLPIDPGLAPGTRVGSLTLTRVLGSGGMGTVYEAQQEAPRRRVALKMMRRGARADAARRFRYEVEVLASLRHPGIAQVYETGVHEDRPWFAMEFVEDARTIVDWARDGNPGRRERLALFGLVCDAVHHGHTKGVIHRDLKPDNILVDAHGRPKVIDFGVARAIDHEATAHTRAGEVVGTLAYMSPEQIAGDRDALDTRSDVYALGVVLYELLTGELPYSAPRQDWLALVRAVTQESPRRSPALRGDLETIVRKCLEKDSARRYESAAALAGDLQRFARREPIVAHPPSVSYQVRVFARRHRALVAAAIIVLAVAVTGAIVSLDFAFAARDAERAALRDREEAGIQRERARGLFRAQFERGVAFTSRFAPRIHDLAGGAPLSLEMLTVAAKDLEELHDVARGDPEVSRRLIDAHLSLGDARGGPGYANVGDLDGAARHYDTALALARALPPDDRAQVTIAQCLRKQAKVSLARGDAAAARGHIEAALKILQALPAEPEYRAHLASAHDFAGTVASQEMRLDDAASHYERCTSIFGALHAAQPENEEFHRHLALAHAQTGASCLARKSYADAIANYTRANALLDELIVRHPGNQAYRGYLAWNLTYAGNCEQERGDLDAAGALLDRAVSEYEALHEASPRNADVELRLGNAYSVLGFLRIERARRAPASERPAMLEGAAASMRAAHATWARMQEEGRLAKLYANLPGAAQARLEAIEKELAATRAAPGR